MMALRYMKGGYGAVLVTVLVGSMAWHIRGPRPWLLEPLRWALPMVVLVGMVAAAVGCYKVVRGLRWVRAAVWCAASVVVAILLLEPAATLGVDTLKITNGTGELVQDVTLTGLGETRSLDDIEAGSTTVVYFVPSSEGAFIVSGELAESGRTVSAEVFLHELLSETRLVELD